SSDDDDNVPLAMRAKPTTPVKRKNESDDESDTPLSSKVRVPKTNGKKAKKEKAAPAVNKSNGKTKARSDAFEWE
ncbi:hypothetical protein H4S01_006147, partial [Coemansia sp. RSA 2610]